MVQTKEQFVFAYQVILEMYQKLYKEAKKRKKKEKEHVDETKIENTSNGKNEENFSNHVISNGSVTASPAECSSETAKDPTDLQ